LDALESKSLGFLGISFSARLRRPTFGKALSCCSIDVNSNIRTLSFMDFAEFPNNSLKLFDGSRPRRRSESLLAEDWHMLSVSFHLESDP
jgi:hypothetical protein